VPLERLADYVTGIRAAAAARGIPVAIFGHAGRRPRARKRAPDLTVSGWRDCPGGALDGDAAELLLRLGGTRAASTGCRPAARAGLLERFYGPEVAALFRALKQAYDPRLPRSTRCYNPVG